MLFRAAIEDAIRRRDLDFALEESQAAAKWFASADDAHGEATALHMMGLVYRHRDNSPAALNALRTSREIWEALGDDIGLAETLREYGTTLVQQANYAEAMVYFEKCRLLCAQIGDHRGEMSATANVGTIHIEFGDIATSLEMLHRCLPYFEEAGNALSISATLANIAESYNLLDKPEESIAYAQRALTYFETAQDFEGAAQVLGGLGTSYRKLGNLETALDYHRQALAVSERAGIHWITALALIDVGDLFVRLHRFDEAKEVLERSLELNGDQGHRFVYGRALTHLGGLHIDKAYLERCEALALPLLVEARSVAEACDSPILLVPVYTHLAEFYERTGNLRQALDCHGLLRAIERRLFNDESDQRIARVRVQFELEKARKEAEIAQRHSEMLTDALRESERLTEELVREKERLRVSEERLQALITATELVTWTINAEGQVNMDVPEWREFTGMPSVDVWGDRWFAAVHPEDREATRQTIDDSTREGEPFALEYRARRRDGEWRWLGARVAPVFNTDNSVREWIGTSRDITVRKELEAERQRFAEYDHRIAETLQETVLPVLPDRIAPGLTVRTFYQATSDEAAVGGDFYDVFPLVEGKVALVVGDVIGHGLAAALSIAEVRFSLRAFLSLNAFIDLGDALGQLNNFLVRANQLRRIGHLGDYQNRLVAVTLILIEPLAGELRIVSAGMEPALMIRAETGAIETLDAGEMVLGAVANITYTAKRARIEPGDLLAITTDGLTEAFGKVGRRQFGLDGLGESLSHWLSASRLDPDRVRIVGDATLSAVREFVGGSFRDDVCLLLAQVDEQDGK